MSKIFSQSAKFKRVPGSHISERLGIRIVSVSMPGGIEACYVKVSHMHHKAETPLISSKESLAMIGYLCSLPIEDPEDSLLVELKARKKGMFSAGSHAVLGSAAIEIKKMNAVESCRHGVTEPYDFNLVINGVGKEVVGEVKVQVVRVFPPKPGPDSFISAFIGTWNVGNAPPDQDLSSWLQEQHLREVSLVVIGCQECKYKERDGYKDCEDDFVSSIGAVVGKRHSLFRVNRLGEMRLLIWARLDAVAGIHSIEWDEEAVGVGHVMANKGALAAALFIWDTSLCFVNSHLAAHQDKCKRRNEDFAEIVAGMNLGFPNCGIVNQFHHTVWMGDLNYRLDLSHMFDPEIANARSPTPELFNKIKELVRLRALDTLLECDQLVQQRRTAKAFKGFEEGLIRHVPTFKVMRQIGTEYQDERAPAYCDRVLWRSLEGMEVRSLDLWAGERVASSDHKPVGTVIQLRLRAPRPEWWPRVVRDVDRGVQKHSAHHVTHDNTHVPCWRVRLVELHGEGLTPSDMNGKADPYIAFVGDALPQWAFTEVQYRTLNPEWKPSTLPSFLLAALSKEALKEEYIVLQAMDHDRFDPDDAIGTAVLPLRDLLDDPDHEHSFDVELLHGGQPGGVIRGKLRIQEAGTMTATHLRKQRLAKQRFEPNNLCCFNLCVCRNPFASDPPPPTHSPHRAPPPVQSHPSALAPLKPSPPDLHSPASAQPPIPPALPAARSRDLAIETVAAPGMRRFDHTSGPAGWGAGGVQGPPSSHHSSVPLTFDPVKDAPPVFPSRLGPGQFIPARHAAGGPAPSSPAEGVWGQQQQQQQQQQQHGGVRGRSEAGPSARAPPYSSPNAHFASFRPPAGSSEQLASRPRLPGGYELNNSQPVYVPPWERAGFEPPTILSTGTYNKSQMYDSHYPPPRFRGYEAAARP